MALRTFSRAAALLLTLVLLAAAASGCGGSEDDGQNTGGGEQHGEGAFREGLFEEYNGLEYKVFLTRQLNHEDPEDRAYVKGPEAPPPGQIDYGVFIQVCNMGDAPESAAESMTVVDTLGNEFEPITLPDYNVFAYVPRVLQPDECIPDPVSLAAQGPAGGALLLYRMPLETTENRPLRLEVRDSAPAAETGEGSEALAFELDI
jgi:hypothetical protein